MHRHVQVRVDGDLMRWFDATFPHMSKQAFLEMCFLELRRAVEAGELRPDTMFGGIVAHVAERER